MKISILFSNICKWEKSHLHIPVSLSLSPPPGQCLSSVVLSLYRSSRTCGPSWILYLTEENWAIHSIPGRDPRWWISQFRAHTKSSGKGGNSGELFIKFPNDCTKIVDLWGCNFMNRPNHKIMFLFMTVVNVVKG